MNRKLKGDDNNDAQGFAGFSKTGDGHRMRTYAKP